MSDINGDGNVNVLDLNLVIVGWGPCEDPSALCFDVNDDGVVNVFDLIEVIEQWGPCS